MTIGLKRIFVIAVSCTVMLLIHGTVSAATGVSHVDVDGDVTGKAGATYYDVSTWQDMFDTYKNVAPDLSSNNTVYLNVIDDVSGSSAISTGAKLVSGKSVSILGNGHTLYFDTDTNYTSANTGGTSASVGFYGTGTISENTNAQIKNVKWLNNRASGIFPVMGSNAKVNTYYEDVTEYNGDGMYGASPIINEAGRIYFSGNNSFKVLKGLGMTSKDTWADAQFEWIRGGRYIEVLNGSTNVMLNAYQDQLIYPNGQGTGQTIKIDDNAKMNWSLGNYYSLYFGSATSGPLLWDLGKNSELTIQDSGVSQTGNWFAATNFNSWTVNAAEGAKLSADTAGGSININAFSRSTTWNFLQKSNLFLNNKANGSLFTGNPGTGSSLNFNDVNQITMLAANSPVFSTNSNIPINITGGEGLRLHASSKQPSDINNISDTDNISGSDVWERVATGSTTGTFTASSMAPNNYSSDTLSYMQKAKYLRWYQPNGLGVSESSLDRNFTIDLGKLPSDGSWSSKISGDDRMTLNFMDDRGNNPDFKIQLSQLKNNTPNSTQYLWQNPNSETQTLIDENPITLATVKDDSQLPENVTMTMAGGNYSFSYDKNSGLILKANNKLKVQNSQQNATFRYSIIAGP